MFYKKIRLSKTFLTSDFAGEDFQRPGLNKFWAMDSKQNLEKNLKTLPEDWYYRTHDVNYTVNSMGYRAPEFDQIDWANSLVMFGCSTVFGDGVDDKDTLPAQLSRIVNKPVINMGAGGSSIEWAFHNSLILKEFYPAPIAVIHFWTDPSRLLAYERETPQKYGVWHKDYNKHVRSEEDIATKSYFTRLAAKNIWTNSSIYYDLSWSPAMVEITGCDNIPDESRTVDAPINLMGRDLCHQGKIPLGIVADYISKKLKDLGLIF